MSTIIFLLAFSVRYPSAQPQRKKVTLKSKCDYHFDRPLTEQEIKQIEKEVNDVIQADMAVTQEFITKEESQKNYNLERLPQNVGDDIRIVKIGDYDACPCNGVHVNSTKEIGKFQIASASFDNGVLRIRYKLSHLDT